MRLLLLLVLIPLMVTCQGAPRASDIRQREAAYRQRLEALPRQATRNQLERAFPSLRHLSPPRGPESGSVLTGTEQFQVDADFMLDVKFMYAAPYRIAAGATRLGAQAAADEGPSVWQVFGFVREAVRGPFAESPQDEVLSARLLRRTSR